MATLHGPSGIIAARQASRALLRVIFTLLCEDNEPTWIV
jgi:hypothetical protein